MPIAPTSPRPLLPGASMSARRYASPDGREHPLVTNQPDVHLQGHALVLGATMRRPGQYQVRRGRCRITDPPFWEGGALALTLSHATTRRCGAQHARLLGAFVGSLIAVGAFGASAAWAVFSESYGGSSICGSNC